MQLSVYQYLIQNLAFQRSLADFLPLLSLPSDIKVGVIDYIIKIVTESSLYPYIFYRL
jgi:hypothetical protein